ncbi:MAG: hypothetical protein D6677_10840 [Calditrichaeota bacterium]|nr:MAG: hypothetical protein D6677_10840 [Calditrichota bacterium]
MLKTALLIVLVITWFPTSLFAGDEADRAFKFWQKALTDSSFLKSPNDLETAVQGLEFFWEQYPGHKDEDEVFMLLARLHARLKQPQFQWNAFLRLVVLHGQSPLAPRARARLDSLANYTTAPLFSIRNIAGLNAFLDAEPESDYRLAFIRYLDILITLDIPSLYVKTLQACDLYLRKFTLEAPDADLVLYWRGLIKFRSEAFTAARYDFLLLHSVFPESRIIPNAIYQLARITGKEHPEEAKAWLIELLNQYPDHELSDDAQFLFSELDYKSGRPDNALNDYRLLIKLFPQSPFCAKSMLRMGQIQEDRGKFKEAVTAYRQVLLYPADDSTAKNALTRWIHVAADLLKNGVMEANARLAYVNRFPNASDAAGQLWRAAKLFEKAGRKKQARALFKRLVDDYPASPHARKAIKQNNK